MKQQIIDAIKKYETIIIHRHVSPDPDAYGSQSGLANLIQTSFPKKKVYIVGEEQKTLDFMAKMDSIPDELYNDALVIAVDTANMERISDDRYNTGDMLIKIDHHPDNEPYGDLSWVDTSASSVSEMIFELYSYGKEQGLQLNDEGARVLYAGIVGDTGRFMFNNTKPKTFHTVAELIEFNFKVTDIYDDMYQSDIRVARLNGYVMQHFEYSEEGVGSIRITKELLAQFDLTHRDASQLPAGIGDIEGIKSWVLLIEEPTRIRARIRSKGVVINGIAEKYNGGGHPLASGASVYSWEEADKLVEDMRKAAREY